MLANNSLFSSLGDQVNNVSGTMFNWQEVPHGNISPERVAPTITSMEDDVMKYIYLLFCQNDLLYAQVCLNLKIYLTMEQCYLFK